MADDLVIFNDKIISKSQLSLDINNRSFRYGDGLFESARMHDGKVMFFNYHFERLTAGINLLQLVPEENFTEENLLKQIHRLKSIYTGTKEARVRITLYRNGGGLYTPNFNTFSCLIELTPLAINGYPLNVNGLKTDVFTEIKKPMSILSNYKTNNALTSVLAGIFKTKNGLDEAIILNQNNNICESISSNIFFISNNNEIVTPALNQACLAGVMRRVVIENTSADFKVIEKTIEVEDFKSFKECFLTNASRGIQWVESIGEKKFENSIIKSIHQLFLEKALNKQL